MRRITVFLGCITAIACSRSESATAPDPAASQPAKSSPSGTNVGAPLVLARGLRFVKPSSEADVAKLVRAEREKAAADGRDLVVYVGAKWCEPCQRFHEAARRGDLDADFPELNILDFDLDEDRERISAAGYMSKLIPLFVLPGADGRASERRFEGGVKGDRAVSQLTPRLRSLLAK